VYAAVVSSDVKSDSFAVWFFKVKASRCDHSGIWMTWCCKSEEIGEHDCDPGHHVDPAMRRNRASRVQSNADQGVPRAASRAHM
jgi:hypothetical protein